MSFPNLTKSWYYFSVVFSRYLNSYSDRTAEEISTVIRHLEIWCGRQAKSGYNILLSNSEHHGAEVIAQNKDLKCLFFLVLTSAGKEIDKYSGNPKSESQ